MSTGTLGVFRRALPLSDKQIALLQTFANQAVIAVENAWLFEAEQARTKELTEALEYQTATSEVLGFISRSPNELQPVLDIIAVTAGRLREAHDAVVLLREGNDLRTAAHDGPLDIDFVIVPIPRGRVSGRAVLEGIEPESIVTDALPSYGSALRALGRADRRLGNLRENNRAENSHLAIRRRERKCSVQVSALGAALRQKQEVNLSIPLYYRAKPLSVSASTPP